ncbi:MAG: HAD hydrolase family protein [Acidobacteria bacterium]|nr:HAD hydrolase family protein [Acidobacteriota bacterium]
MAGPASREELDIRARRVRLLLLDVDGVLTDGTVHIHAGQGESKGFFIRDGAAMAWARRDGLEIGLLSGRPSDATVRRASELGLTIVCQPGPDKRQAYADILTGCGCADEETAYMGDDLLDLPVLQRVGLSAAPADAVDDVRSRVHWVSAYPGGRGAVRELIELILRAQGRWDGLVSRFLDRG